LELAREEGIHPYESERDFDAERGEAERERAAKEEEQRRREVEEQNRKLNARVAAEKEAEARKARRATGFVEYEYQMVQVPTTLQVYNESQVGNVGSQFLSRLVGDWAAAGWEFYRVDTVGIRVNPGCLSLLFGGQVKYVEVYVVTFRRPVLT
jgi:hypothetical protein